MSSRAGNREEGENMREGARVFGASHNPITGLVKRP